MATDEELANRLRSLAQTLHETAADEGGRREALRLLDEAESHLSIGERRLRWYELDDVTSGRRGRTRDLSPWSGRLNVAAPPMQIDAGERDGIPCIVGRVRMSRLREGPPNGVHGGVMAGLFDETMAAALRLAGAAGAVTGRLTVRYRQITPTETDLVFRAWVERDTGLRIDVKAECLVASTLDDERPRPTAEAQAIFVRRR